MVIARVMLFCLVVLGFKLPIGLNFVWLSFSRPYSVVYFGQKVDKLWLSGGSLESETYYYSLTCLYEFTVH